MQMALVLVTGSALAAAPAIKKGISALAGLPKTPAGAIALVTGISALACWLNWGFGLIVGVIFAKEIAKKLKGVDYRLLIASAYSGFVVWHAGLSGSIPLTMASMESNLEKVTNGTLTQPIPVSETILTYQNLIMVAVVIVAIVVVNALMHPKGTRREAGKQPCALMDHSLVGLDLSRYQTVRQRWQLRLRRGHHAIPVFGRHLARHAVGIRQGLRKVGGWCSRHIVAVPILCRHHGHHHGSRGVGHLLGRGGEQRLRFHLHAKDLSFVHFLLCGHFEYVRAVGWWPLGHPSADYVYSWCCLGRGSGLDGHGHLLG